jgi:long-subunit fatty acid transport protein
MNLKYRELFSLASFLLFASLSTAQEGPVAFEFSFSNPGARSLGLGGAFAALADDATAAFANPAGIVQLLEPEVSIEGRSWSYDTPFVRGGRASGEPTGIGLDSVSGLSYGVSANDLAGVSFLSFVYPGKKWSLAAYRHRWADFALSRRVDSLFAGGEGELDRAGDVLSQTDFQVTNNGIVGAYEVVENLSVGLGVVYFQAEMDSSSLEFALGEDGPFAPNPRTPELLDTSYSLRGEDSGIVFHTGVSYRPSPRWSLAGYFREGPALTVQVTEVVGPSNDVAAEGTIELQGESPLELPDVYGFGLAYRSLDGALTVGFEWDRVLYSSITEGLDEEVFDPGQIRMSDGNEIRVGTEYVFMKSKPVFALRAGAWHDPAHRLGSGPEADVFERAVFDGGEDQLHVSGGAGVVFDRVQLDFGFDLAKTTDQISVTVVYRF